LSWEGNLILRQMSEFVSNKREICLDMLRVTVRIDGQLVSS